MITQAIKVEFYIYLFIRLFGVSFLHLSVFSTVHISFFLSKHRTQKGILMAIKKFNDRLTPEEKKELERWDKFLRNDNKTFANANRRDRYHNLGSLDKNISIDGRNTDLYELIADTSPNSEEVCLQNEMLGLIANFIETLNSSDKIIMQGKLADKPMSSTKLAKLTVLSDKTVTAHFKKHQEALQNLLKDYV